MLVADKIINEHGLKISKKIIPFGTVWSKDTKVGSYTYKKGELYKADKYMPGGIKGITIHNTNDLVNVNDDAEQYSRATINQNMGDARVHYYVDDLGAWQLLEDNEIGWHAGTGANGFGNIDTIAIEIIMDGSKSKEDLKAESNGALLTAILLHKYNLTIHDVYKHQNWSGKYCPRYILDKNGWDDFKNQVNMFMEKIKINNSADSDEEGVAALNKKIKVLEDELNKLKFKRYKNIADMPSWLQVYVKSWVDKGYIKGNTTGELDFTEDMLRCLIISERMMNS